MGNAKAQPLPLDGAVRTAITAVAGSGLLFSLGALAWFGWATGLGVAVGALVATVNLWAFAHVGRGVLGGGPRARLWGLLGALKMIGLMGLVYLLLKTGLVPALALVAGYAALPLGASLATFIGPAPGEDDPQLSHGASDLSADLVTGPRPDAVSGD